MTDEAENCDPEGRTRRQSQTIPVVRPHRLAADWEPPAVTRIHEWVVRLADGPPALLTVSAPLAMYRHEVFDWCFSTHLNVLGIRTDANVWLSNGPLKTFTSQVRGLGDEPWDLLWLLLDVDDFVVEEPLRNLVDQGFRFTGFFKALWEARFLLSESDPAADDLVEALTTWMTAGALSSEQCRLLEKSHITRELESPQERLDMLLFLLALAHQNGIVDRTVFIFDGIDEAVRLPPQKRRPALRELLELVTAFERWAKLGSAAGLVFGLDKRQGALGLLKKHNPKLSDLVQASLV